ncbi:MAG: rhomboid family intramembrane serine protease [Planctomycetota bacterium]
MDASERDTPQRRCPRDRRILDVQMAGDVQVDVCSECDGVWLDPGEVTEIFPDFPVDSLHARPLTSCRTFAVYPCVACHRGSLVPNYFGVGRNRFEVDVCDQCGGLWLDVRMMKSLGRQRRSLEDPDSGSAAPEVPATSVMSESTAELPASAFESVASGATAQAPISDSGVRAPMISFPKHPREWFVTLTGIPVELSNPCRIVPYASIALVLSCIVGFLFTWFGDSEAIVREYALIPSALQSGEVYRLVTGMFLHASVAHIGMNLFFLYTFGDNLEEKYGPITYLALYFAAGIAGGLVSCADGLVTDPDLPRVGASGAVSGLLGAYLLTFPRTRILMAIPFVKFVPIVLRWPVWIYLIIWAGANWIGYQNQKELGVYAIDHVAHLVGFAVGVVAGAFAALGRTRLPGIEG